MAAEVGKGPLEKLCQENDLAVVVKFLGAAEIPPKEAESLARLIDPRGRARQDAVLRRCGFEIVEVLRNNSGEKRGDTISAVAYFDTPDENPIRVTPAGTVYFGKGSRHILILSRLAKDKDYYVSPSTPFRMIAYPEEVARVRVAANPEKWEWSSSVNGLSLAMNIWNTGYDDGSSYAEFVLAIRNETKKTIEFMVVDEASRIEARDPNGVRIKAMVKAAVNGCSPLFAARDPNEIVWPTFPGRKEIPVRAAIKAGEMMFVRDGGIHIKKGRAELRGVWEVPKAKDAKLWSGKIVTERVEIAAPGRRAEKRE